MQRKVMACQHCGIYFKVSQVDIHEVTCHKNPSAPRRIRVGMRHYIERVAIHTVEAPPIRTSMIQFKWGDKAPVMRDQAFRLLKAGLLQRSSKGNFSIFEPIDNVTGDQMDIIWEEVEKARRMGAKL